MLFDLQSALILNNRTGEVLYQKNMNRVMPIASISKLMSAMVTLDGAAGHTGQDAKKDDKKRQRKRKGHILRPQDAAPETVDGQAQGAGSLNDLQPIETQEDDRW